jgi:hypothetical protein
MALANHLHADAHRLLWQSVRKYCWRQRRNYHGDEKLPRFTPPDEQDRKARRVIESPDEDYFFPTVGLGSLGEQQGIGAHWDLWMLHVPTKKTYGKFHWSAAE